MIDRPPLLEEPFAQTLSGKRSRMLYIEGQPGVWCTNVYTYICIYPYRKYVSMYVYI